MTEGVNGALSERRESACGPDSTVVRLGGEVRITNEELYDAMMPASGVAERFVIEETAGGIRVSVRESP
jgi:hypothetical protein